MSEKPVIFISHAHTDRPLVELVQAQIKNVFKDSIELFASSIPGTIPPGTNWLEAVEDNLETANAIIVLVTPVSIFRPWIWFETGAFWSKSLREEIRIIPACAPEINLHDLPTPLNLLKGVSLGSSEGVDALFRELCRFLGVGNIDKLDIQAIISHLPEYKKLEVDPQDLDTGAAYVSPYEGYSDSDLEEIISDELHEQKYTYGFAIDAGALESYEPFGVFGHGLIHYREMDERLKLPPGTSKRLLEKVALRYDLIPTHKGEDTIRFAQKLD